MLRRHHKNGPLFGANSPVRPNSTGNTAEPTTRKRDQTRVLAPGRFYFHTHSAKTCPSHISQRHSSLICISVFCIHNTHPLLSAMESPVACINPTPPHLWPPSQRTSLAARCDHERKLYPVASHHCIKLLSWSNTTGLLASHVIVACCGISYLRIAKFVQNTIVVIVWLSMILCSHVKSCMHGLYKGHKGGSINITKWQNSV